MARQIIGTEDPNADSIQTAFTKTNTNFANLWEYGPVDSDIKITADTISATPTSPTGDINIIPGAIGKVNIDVLDVDIINVHTNFNADVINAGNNITTPSLTVTTLNALATIHADNIDISTELVVNNNTTLHRDLIITDGQSSPENYFSVSNTTGRTTVNKVLNLPIESNSISRTGQNGDKAGDVRIDKDYIYICFEDWVNNAPLSQPPIWGRSSLDWLP